MLVAPPVVSAAPASSATFVFGVVAAAPGVTANVTAVVTGDNGVLVATLPSSSDGVLEVLGLVPGVTYTLHASCVDSIGGTCPSVSHQWHSGGCPASGAQVLHGAQAVALAPGKRLVTWAFPATGSTNADAAVESMEYSLDGGLWTAVSRAQLAEPPTWLLVRGVVHVAEANHSWGWAKISVTLVFSSICVKLFQQHTFAGPAVDRRSTRRRPQLVPASCG